MITNGDSKTKACVHRSERASSSIDKDHQKTPSTKPSGSSNPTNSGGHGDESKKSLSFFPEDSGESSSDEQGISGSERNNNSTGALQPKTASPKQPSLSEPAEIRLEHKVAVPMESDHDESSSTSSCSCEEHSSVHGKSGEDDDPHGDLDYDDDSITNSPIRGERRRTDSRAGESQQVAPAPQEPTATSDSLNNGAFSVESPESQTKNELNGAPQQHGTRIRSFINLDRTNESDNGKPHDETVKRQLKDRSHKSYESLLRYFFKDTCYFQIKSINHENVAISKSMGVWSTPMQNEIRLNTAFREHRNVILIFSVQQSGAFQGFARMISESKPAVKPIPWVLPGRLSNATLGGVFQVQWLCTKELDFNKTRDLHNPFNNNKPIKVARDGQQVEPKTGRKLCSLFPRDSKKKLLACVEKLKAQTKQRKQSAEARNGYYPMISEQREGMHNRRNMHNAHDQHHLAALNGYGPMGVGPSSSHTLMYHHQHPYSADHNGFRGPPMPGARRRAGGPFPPHPAAHRRRGGPHLDPNLHPRAYDDAMLDYGDPSQRAALGYPDIPHNGYYPEPHHHQHTGPDYPAAYSGGPPMGAALAPHLMRPPQQQLPRAHYYEYNMGPARFHPYQRGRR